MSTLKAKVASATPSRSPSPSPRARSRSSVDLTEGDKYRLLVTAGPSYDVSTHKLVHVNSDTPTAFENESMRVKVKVRIRGFRGLPSSCPSTSPYFDDAAHKKDQYSIAFSFVPKVDIPSTDLVWGNDFDHPVRDRLPPGFNTAFKIVKDWIDPGLECDAYADKPWLYGPALSCWFGLRIGDKIEPGQDLPEGHEEEDILREGADGSGQEVRASHGVPDNNEKRRKYFLSAAHREAFTFEKDRLYQADFHNPYLDFGNFALKLPGFSIKVIKYIDEKSHTLRYVFKNRKTEEVYFSVNLNLLWGEQLQKALKEDEGQLESLAGGEANGYGHENGVGSQKAEPEVEAQRAKDPVVAAESSKEPDVTAQTSKQPDITAETSKQPDIVAEKPREPDVVAEKPKQPDVEADEPKQAEISYGDWLEDERKTDNAKSPGMRDKTDALKEQIQHTTIDESLQGTSTGDKTGARTNMFDDLD